jgi:hypothetical protein
MAARLGEGVLTYPCQLSPRGARAGQDHKRLHAKGLPPPAGRAKVLWPGARRVSFYGVEPPISGSYVQASAGNHRGSMDGIT